MKNPIIDLASFRDRTGFGRFLNDRGLTQDGVEVGAHRGHFAEMLLPRWKGFLYLVDPWCDPEGYEEQASDLKALWGTDGNRFKDLVSCNERLRPYAKRYKIVRKTSLAAALEFSSDSLDFVYIDGDHREHMVEADLEAWYTKVKPGGILAGHDVLCINEKNGGWGREIQAALFRFAMVRELTIHLVMEENNSPWSFYVEKPK